MQRGRDADDECSNGVTGTAPSSTPTASDGPAGALPPQLAIPSTPHGIYKRHSYDGSPALSSSTPVILPQLGRIDDDDVFRLDSPVGSSTRRGGAAAASKTSKGPGRGKGTSSTSTSRGGGGAGDKPPASSSSSGHKAHIRSSQRRHSESGVPRASSVTTGGGGSGARDRSAVLGFKLPPPPGSPPSVSRSGGDSEEGRSDSALSEPVCMDVTSFLALPAAVVRQTVGGHRGDARVAAASTSAVAAGAATGGAVAGDAAAIGSSRGTGSDSGGGGGGSVEGGGIAGHGVDRSKDGAGVGGASGGSTVPSSAPTLVHKDTTRLVLITKPSDSGSDLVRDVTPDTLSALSPLAVTASSAFTDRSFHAQPAAHVKSSTGATSADAVVHGRTITDGLCR